MSALSSMRLSSPVPLPWPVSALILNKIGFPDELAACRRAAILREL